MRSIDYARVKGFNKLFLEYINNYPRLDKYFSGNPQQPKAWSDKIAKLKSRSYQREEIAGMLTVQNSAGDNKMIAAQIEKIKNPESVAVVTGQQAGLFLGPLYTVYKALTTIRLAEKIEKEHGIPAVPIFWLEVDDHDIKEVSHFTIMEPRGELTTIRYEDENPEKLYPVGNRKFNDAINEIYDTLKQSFGETDNATATLEKAKRIYKQGESFPDSFVDFFRTFFPKESLLFVNPSTEHFKRLAKPFFKKIITDDDALERSVLEQSKNLKADSLDPQLKIREGITHAFNLQKGERKRINKVDISVSVDEFVEQNYESISTDVVTRPLLQDFVFPTIAYVAGPSETAYLGQLKSAYAALDIEMPLVFPRWSGTFIDGRTTKFLEDQQITLDDTLTLSEKAITDSIVEKNSDVDIDAVFRDAGVQVCNAMDEITDLAGRIDKSLVNMVESNGNKINFQIEKMKEKLKNSHKNAHKQAIDKVARALNVIYPDGKPQERNYSILNFLLRYGTEFSDKLTENVSTDTYKHHLLES